MPRLTHLLVTSSLVSALAACGGTDDSEPSSGGAAGMTASGGQGGSSGGSSGASGSSGSGGAASDPTIPAMLTQAAWDTFMSSKAYTMTGWTSDVMAPRDPSSTVSPHGKVRVWLNNTLVSSIQAGNGAMVTSPPHTQNSMVVKELYDDAGMLVGHAASLKVDAGGGGTAWQYYCKAPAGRCYSSSPDLSTTPLFAKGDANCGGCHGGLVFTMLPP